MKTFLTKLPALIAALLLMAVLLPCSYGGDPGIVKIQVKDRERYYHRLRSMRAQNPENAEISYQIANLFYSLEMVDEAIFEYRRTLKLDPEHDYAKWFLSKSLEDKGYFEDAFWLVRELIEKHNQVAGLYDRAGELLEKMNRPASAKEYFARYDELKYGEVAGDKPIKTLTQSKAGEWKQYFY